MINYYFFQFIKKTDRTVDCPVPSRGGPAPGGQRWDGFDFFEFKPPRTGPYGPCGTVDRTICKSLCQSHFFFFFFWERKLVGFVVWVSYWSPRFSRIHITYGIEKNFVDMILLIWTIELFSSLYIRFFWFGRSNYPSTI
jgi:hypothetical protein